MDPLPPETQAKLDELTAAYDALAEEHGDDPPEGIAQELERLSSEIDELSEARLHWSSEEKVRAGAILAIDPNGGLRIERGLVKTEVGSVMPVIGSTETTHEPEPEPQ